MGYNAVRNVPTLCRLEIEDMPAKWNPPDLDNLVKCYLAGESTNRLATRHGVARQAIDRCLRTAGVRLRCRSEAELLKWSRMSDDQRAHQVAAAHATSLGHRRSVDFLIARAASQQRRRANISHHEIVLQSMLTKRGLETGQQVAIGPYNCDLAARPVAVEVFGGHWHFSGDHLKRMPKRTRYLFDAGWHLLVVVVATGYPLTDATADYVAAFVDEMRRKPPVARQYRMVWGAAEVIACGSSDDDQLAFVPPFGCGRNRTSGRYQRVPR